MGFCQRNRCDRCVTGYHFKAQDAIIFTGVRADSVAVDWLGRNLYWIDGVNSQIAAIRLATASVDSSDHIIILDEDLDQPRSLALLPQKGLVRFHCALLFMKTSV